MTCQVLRFPLQPFNRRGAAFRAYDQAEEHYRWVLANFDATRPSSVALFRHADERRALALRRLMRAIQHG